MLKVSGFYLIVVGSLIALNAQLLNSVSIYDQLFLRSKSNHPRNLGLDSPIPIHSVPLLSIRSWYGVPIMPDADTASRDLYLPTGWAIFISSNETILSNGGCPLFNKFSCTKPDCIRTNTPLETQNYPLFSSSEFSRIDLTQPISFANGAWKINASITYFHSCEHSFNRDYGRTSGQIGLGLSGKAYQHFQDQNPTFSIYFNSKGKTSQSETLGELIFGFNSSYVKDPSSAISLPCDLDWKMQVNSVSLGDSVLLSTSVKMIFDLQTPCISLPPALYSGVKDYFFNLESMTACSEQSSSFKCFFFGDLRDLPIFVFTLTDGTQLQLSPAAFMIKHEGGYLSCLDFYNSKHTEVEYIILGREVMTQYYTLFQKLDNQDPMITLYPFDSNGLKLNSDPETNVRNSSQTESYPASTTETSKTESLSAATAEKDSNENINIHKNDGSDRILLYFVICCIFICVFIVCVVVARKTGSKQKESVDIPRSTVELNESSYFVSSGDNNTRNENSNEISE